MSTGNQILNNYLEEYDGDFTGLDKQDETVELYCFDADIQMTHEYLTKEEQFDVKKRQLENVYLKAEIIHEEEENNSMCTFHEGNTSWVVC